MKAAVFITLAAVFLAAMFVNIEAAYNRIPYQQNYRRNNFYRPRPINRAPFHTSGTYIHGGPLNNGVHFSSFSPNYDDPLQYFRPDHGLRCPADGILNDCPLYNLRSNLVTKEDFLAEISVRNNHFNLYSIEITDNSLGKCRISYHSPNIGGTFLQEEQCFSNRDQTCTDLSVIAELTDDDCGRATLRGVNASYEEKFYSQDLSAYFWREICDGKTPSGECPNAYFFDLNVFADRLVDSDQGNVADLSSLPWGKIAADLEIIKGTDTSDPGFRYVEKGTECPVF